MPKDKMPQVYFFGDRVGKTSLIKRVYFNKESFQENEKTTIGSDIRIISKPQERLVTEVSSNNSELIKQANVVVLCVDVTNPGDIQQQYDSIKKNAPNATILIAGTKGDVKPNNTEAVNNFAKDNKITCVITSAKDDLGLVELKHVINQNLIYNQHQSEIERVKHKWFEAVKGLRAVIPVSPQFEPKKPDFLSGAGSLKDEKSINPRFKEVIKYLDELESTLNKEPDPEKLNAAIHDFKTKSDKALGSESEVLKNKVKMVAAAAFSLVSVSLAVGLSVIGILTAPMGLGVLAIGVGAAIDVVTWGKKALAYHKENQQIAEDKKILDQPLQGTESFKP